MKNAATVFACMLTAGSIFFSTIDDVSAAAFNVQEIHAETVSDSHSQGIEKDNWSLRYKVNNHNLYLECVISDFSLEKDGYLLVKMNGMEAAKMQKAAFMMKNLPPGEHTIEVVPVLHNGEKHGEIIEFSIKINGE
ncbi:hypothetical protein [Bacillus piscicola]|uniref:hypothetical protein n=1 Tax=Bacillus piscicola TaxID=1632684 RepID=UPI001F08A977|nr:hypothetical protein [Bacillus piscicola]